MKLHRYPGVKPFETSDAALFFGRQRDCRDLLDLILLEKLVVVFGKSGYGKSSLLNAGVIPGLAVLGATEQRRFTPLVIRFKSYIAGESLPLVSTVQEKLRQMHLGESRDAAFEKWWQGRNRPDSLWFEFKRWSVGTGRRYVLIFDQFEEFFTYPADQQLRFREELAELLYTEIPQIIRDDWNVLSEVEKEFLSVEMDIRAVFAIREDRLSWINSMKGELPAILHKRFELKGMTEEQAREAIILPAKMPQAQGFESAPFEYSTAALQTLVRELKSGDTGRIEAFLLQICCESVEKVVLEKQKSQGNNPVVIQPGDLPRFDKIYEDYYENKIIELPAPQQAVAKRLIENELVAVNPATGLALRLNADGRKLVAGYKNEGVTEELLLKLTGSFLLRSEPNTTGGFNFEISHDTLLDPILHAKREREAQEFRKRQQRRLRRAAMAVVFSLVLLTGALIFGAWALRQRDEAVKQQRVADERFKSFLREQIERQKLEMQQLERKVDVYQRGGEELLAQQALQNIQQLKSNIQENEHQLQTFNK